jgi:hypothetical protein
VILLPAISALIAFGCVAVIARDALRRTTPDRIAWIIAFATFGIAAAAEVIGDTAGWSAPLARLYYLTGAVLVVGYLALGQLYLLFPDRIRKVAPGVALLVTAVSASTVWSAPIDRSRLADDGWDAITRTTGLTLLAVSINSIGTLILLGGLVYSAIRFKRSGLHRNRMIGCLLIALGTLAVAMGGTLTRFGSDQYLYIAMSIGIALIFGGYGWMKRGEQASRRAGEQRGGAGPAATPAANINPSAVSLGEASFAEPGVSTPGPGAHAEAPLGPSSTPGHPAGALIPGGVPTTPGGAVDAAGIAASDSPVDQNLKPKAQNPGIAFIETRLHALSDEALAEECRVWSVPAREINAFNRAEARRVWSFRNRLSPAGQLAFDQRPAGLRLQLAELYFEVMTAEIAAVERPPVAPLDRLAGREHNDAQSARAAGGSVD